MDGEVLPGDNADKAAKAIEIMTNWRENGCTPEQAEYAASVALFSAGNAAFHINGVWEVPTFTDLHAKGSLGSTGARSRSRRCSTSRRPGPTATPSPSRTSRARR